MQNETVAKDMLEWYGTDPEGPTPLEEHGSVEDIVNPFPGELSKSSHGKLTHWLNLWYRYLFKCPRGLP